LGASHFDEAGDEAEAVWWAAHTDVVAEGLVTCVRGALAEAHNLGARQGRRQVELAGQLLRRNPWAWLALTGSLGPAPCALPAYSEMCVDSVRRRLEGGKVTVEFDEVRVVGVAGVSHAKALVRHARRTLLVLLPHVILLTFLSDCLPWPGCRPSCGHLAII